MQVRVEGHNLPLRFIVDTGAQVSALRTAVPGISKREENGLISGVGKSNVTVTHIQELTFSIFNEEGDHCLASNYTYPFRIVSFPWEADGLLGLDILKSLGAVIDTASGNVYIPPVNGVGTLMNVIRNKNKCTVPPRVRMILAATIYYPELDKNDFRDFLVPTKRTDLPGLYIGNTLVRIEGTQDVKTDPSKIAPSRSKKYDVFVEIMNVSSEDIKISKNFVLGELECIDHERAQILGPDGGVESDHIHTSPEGPPHSGLEGPDEVQGCSPPVVALTRARERDFNNSEILRELVCSGDDCLGVPGRAHEFIARKDHCLGVPGDTCIDVIDLFTEQDTLNRTVGDIGAFVAAQSDLSNSGTEPIGCASGTLSTNPSLVGAQNSSLEDNHWNCDMRHNCENFENIYVQSVLRNNENNLRNTRGIENIEYGDNSSEIEMNNERNSEITVHDDINEMNMMLTLRPPGGSSTASLPSVGLSQHHQSPPTFGLLEGASPQISENDTSIDQEILGKFKSKLGHLSGENYDMMIQLLKEYKELFHIGISGCNVKIKHRIHTGTEAPIYKRPYRIPESQKIHMRNCLNELLEKNIIRPSYSPWGAPSLLVTKKPNGEGPLNLGLLLISEL
jgi:Retroviral aspartyl protease